MELTILNRQRGRQIALGGLEGFLRRLAAAIPAPRPGTLTVCLVSDRRMREYNRSFRNVDRSTDVLAFADGEDNPDGSMHLGDIVIAVPTAARQSRQRGHSFVRELKVLALHGYLHLLGYDHEGDSGEMMRLQRKLERTLVASRRREAAN